MTIGGVIWTAVRKAVRMLHNIHIRSVRHAVRNPWSLLADSLDPIPHVGHGGGGATSLPRLRYHRMFAEAAESENRA